MKTEREEKAVLYRAEGARQAELVRATAEKDREIIVAKAYEEAQGLRGQGDAEATQIYADAYNKDPRFFSFVRHMATYEKIFNSGTTILLRPESDLLRFLESPLEESK
jgi:membrane protease subunit HflC